MRIREGSIRCLSGASAIILLGAAMICSACSKPKSQTTRPKITVSTIPGIGQIMWRTPENLIEIGFSRSRVVMMNEFHSGFLRCIRTRKLGRRILPTAHRIGVRYLAMEALDRETAHMANKVRRIPWGSYSYFQEGYLSQPEMQAFIQAALDLDWTLLDYEPPVSAYREESQAYNLSTALESLPPDSKMLVWCGNSHHEKSDNGEDSFMGHFFWKYSGIEPFVIDQNQSIVLPDSQRSKVSKNPLVKELKRLGLTEAGFLLEEAPPKLRWEVADAFIISTQNSIE